LYDLTRKDAVFKFEETERQEFETLKDRLINAPILNLYSPRDETELHCDASVTAGFGEILLQKRQIGSCIQYFIFLRGRPKSSQNIIASSSKLWR